MHRTAVGTLRLGLAVALLSATVLAFYAAVRPATASHHQSAPIREIDFRNEMRKLWEDHVTWTRLFVVSALADLPDTGPTAARLLRNQDDIGNAVKPFYGEAAGDQLSALLRDHILIAADLVAAAKAGDTAAFDDAHTRWYANADDIAAFLAAANPKHWPEPEMRAMMREHLDLTIQEVGARLDGDWETDIAAYDLIHLQALHMADMLSGGIIEQFPQHFRRTQ